MNQHTIIGNLTRDPDTGTTESGINYCSFTVAVNRAGRRDEATFIRVTAWRALADTCGKYLRKGRKVAVTGTSEAHGWIGQDGGARAQIELTARDVEFLSGGRAEGGDRTPTDEDAPPARTDPQSGMDVVDPEEQPF